MVEVHSAVEYVLWLPWETRDVAVCEKGPWHVLYPVTTEFED